MLLPSNGRHQRHAVVARIHEPRLYDCVYRPRRRHSDIVLPALFITAVAGTIIVILATDVPHLMLFLLTALLVDLRTDNVLFFFFLNKINC
jgi:hypothetical protein